MSSPAQEEKSVPVIPGAYEFKNGEPHLIGTKCTKCGSAFFPPRQVCSYCLTDKTVEKARLGNTGKLYVYTVINVASKMFNPPYAFGFVMLEPENIRIPTLLSGVTDPNELETGTPLKMVIEKLRTDPSGVDVMTFKFRPLSDRQA